MDDKASAAKLSQLLADFLMQHVKAANYQQARADLLHIVREVSRDIMQMTQEETGQAVQSLLDQGVLIEAIKVN